MRIQHVDQAAKSWPGATADDRQTGVALVKTIDRIRWRLWHGQVSRSLDLIGETLVTLERPETDTSPGANAARKVTRLLLALETYVSGQSDIIIDYATARRQEEPISTAITERTATHAPVSPRCPFDVEGQDLDRERDVRPGSCCRGAEGSLSGPARGVSTPRFWTVSAPLLHLVRLRWFGGIVHTARSDSRTPRTELQAGFAPAKKTKVVWMTVEIREFQGKRHDISVRRSGRGQ